MTLSELIAESVPPAPQPVESPEWPGTDGQLFVAKLAPADRIKFPEALRAQQVPDGDAFLAFVVAYCTVHADGTRVFSDDAWQWLRTKDYDVLERLFIAADRRNNLSSGAKRDLAKNSETPGN